jgi:2-(1,2-epoxy-1,2-dihydrophenyl)acetyl-CoA isomerase
MTEPVLVKREGEIAEVRLNRPQVFNALDFDLMRELSRQLVSLAVDDDVRGVVISGEGKAFCAGGDLKWALGWPHGVPAAFHELAARLHQAIVEIRRMPKPVIAALNAYTSNGLCVDGGGTFTLPRLVGLARALEIVAFDRPISSEQAEAWGLATRVVEDGSALEEAMNMARTLAKGSLHSFGWSKQLLTDSFNTAFETHLERERAGLCSCAAHPDGQEGLRAFGEKRKPVFGAT